MSTPAAGNGDQQKTQTELEVDAGRKANARHGLPAGPVAPQKPNGGGGNVSQFSSGETIETGPDAAFSVQQARERETLPAQHLAPPDVLVPVPKSTKKQDEQQPGPNGQGITSPALEFLNDFFGTEKRHLVAIKKNKGKGSDIRARHFDAVDHAEQQKFITDCSAEGFDIYFSPNPIKGTLHKKASKNDVAEARHLWIDLDPRKDEPLDAERAAMLALLTTNLPPGIPPPNRVIDSGRGYWGYWKLAAPQPVGGGELTEVVEAYGRGIEQAFGDRFADGCRNIDRIARLPRTVNTKTGNMARVLHQFSHDEPYAIESFPRAPTKSTEGTREENFQQSDEYKPVTPETPELAKLEAFWVRRIFEGDVDGKYQNDRSRLAFGVACELVRAGLDDEFIARVLMTTRCGEHLQECSAYRLPRTLRRARANAIDPNLKQMNEDYSAGSVAGKFRVLRWMPDARFPFQRTCEFQTKTDFCSSTVNPKIEVPKFDRNGNQVGIEPKGRGVWWLGQDHRSEFDGIDFRPGAPVIIERPAHDGRTLEIVNMFSGFSCAPSDAGESACDLFLAHVHDNISGGDKKLFNYIMDWMASGVQYPENPGRSSLSLRGDPGCGKGVFALGYGSLYGRHFLHATQREHVVGKFNSHQAESCLIFVDEALYSQIKGDAQILKTLTTETTKLLERKGIDAVQVDNYARLIFATNDPHPIMIEYNDRRYVAIYVRTHPDWAGLPDEEAAPIRKAYFQPILDQMNNGGREALLGLLLNRDINKFNAEAIPATKEREWQKLLSAPASDKIVIEFAQNGRLPCSAAGRPDAARPYADHNRQDGLFPAMKQSSGKALQYESDQDLADILKGWKFQRDRDRHGTIWIAPPLLQLRTAITKKYPAIEWDQDLTDWVREPAECVWQTTGDVGTPTKADEDLAEKIKLISASKGRGSGDEPEFPF